MVPREDVTLWKIPVGTNYEFGDHTRPFLAKVSLPLLQLQPRRRAIVELKRPLLYMYGKCLKKNQNAPRLSEHPPVREKKLLADLVYRKSLLSRRTVTVSGWGREATNGFQYMWKYVAYVHVRSDAILKKNLKASRPSEHPPVRGKNVKTFRWDHGLQIQNLFMAFYRVPRWQ